MQVMSVCPNNCSGHGRCEKDGKCVCFKQAVEDDTSVDAIPSEYGGNDCSICI